MSNDMIFFLISTEMKWRYFASGHSSMTNFYAEIFIRFLWPKICFRKRGQFKTIVIFGAAGGLSFEGAPIMLVLFQILCWIYLARLFLHYSVATFSWVLTRMLEPQIYFCIGSRDFLTGPAREYKGRKSRLKRIRKLNRNICFVKILEKELLIQSLK
jgi:hypothetical protein